MPRCTCCRALHHEVTRRGAYLAYIGSGEFPVKVRVLGHDAIHPGGDGLVRLHLADRLAAGAGRSISCCASPAATRRSAVARCSTSRPVLPASKARPDRSVDRVIAERGWVDVDDLEALTGEQRDADARSWVVASRSGCKRRSSDVSERVAAAGDARPGPRRARRAATRGGIDARGRHRRRRPSSPAASTTIHSPTIRSSPRCSPAASRHPTPTGVDTARAARAVAPQGDRRARRRLLPPGDDRHGRRAAAARLLRRASGWLHGRPAARRHSACRASTPCRWSTSSTLVASLGDGAIFGWRDRVLCLPRDEGSAPA